MLLTRFSPLKNSYANPESLKGKKKMAALEGALFRRSILFAEKWLSELAPPPAAAKPAAKAVAAPAVAAGKHVDPRKGGAAPPPAVEASSMSKVNLVVGKVVDVAKHPDSEKLYVEKIDLGETDGPRTILSGLQEHISIADFMNKLVLVVANLEPRKIGGIPSAGMVLCASTEGKGKVELLHIPEGTPIGERVVFPGHDQAPEPVLKKKLAKHYEDVAPQLVTDSAGVATWNGLPFVTSKGTITSTVLNGHIS